MKKIVLFFALFLISIVYKAQLTYQWANSAGSSTNSEYGQAIASDPSGNVYVTGAFTGVVDFDPSVGTTTLSSLSGTQDIFLAKYDINGAFLWVKQIAGTNTEKPFDLVADASGAYLAGIFMGTVDFNPNAGINNITSLGGGTDGDGFFAKYDVNGNLTWVDRIGSTGNDRVIGIAVDASQNVYVSGFIGANADMDPGIPVVTFAVAGTYNAFFGKYSSTGAYTFAKQITGRYSEGDDINIDASGNIYLTGSYATSNDFDPSGGTANLSTASLTQLDVFLAKYTSAGLYTYAKQIGGIGVDIGFQVVPDALGNVYLGGVFSSSCDFDPTAATSTLTSAGQGDLFVAKYDVSGNLTWKNGTGGTTNDYCYGLGLDASNNVYITGKVQGTNVDFDPSLSSALITASSSCMYIASYSSAGNYLSLSSPGNIASEGRGLLVNSSLYVTGMFRNTGDFDFSASTANLTSLGGDDIFFAKYNTCVGSPPAQPSAIAGNFTLCSGTSQTYSVVNDPLATSYTWSFPVGWTGSSSTNVSVPTVSAGGIISVVANNACGASLAQTVNIVTGPSGATIATSSANCGAANGSATVTAVSDGVPAFQYSFNGGPFVGSSIQGGMVPGPKNVVIKDANLCTFTVNFNIGNTGSPAASIASSTNVGCFNGANGGFSVSVTGGVPAYTYTLIPGNITNGTGLFTNLIASTYTVTVKDGVGCITTIMNSVTQPSSITLTTNVLTANCNQANGSATASAVGGTSPYTYTWSTNFVGSILSNVTAGTYTVILKDANGCTSALATTIPNGPGPVIGISSFTNPSCFGGNNGVATATTTGGAPGPGFPTYIWSNGQNTPTATNLLSGVYTVTVTDAVGCLASTSVTITQPASLTINLSGTNPKCFNASNGSASVSVLGGTPGYNYTWSPTPGVGGNTSSPSGMAPGIYVVVVTDSKGCIMNGSVSLANPPQILSSVSLTNVSCFGLCNGSAIASVTNQIGTVSYSWIPTALTTQNVNNLCSGNYTMMATDQNTCVSMSVFNVNQPAGLVTSIGSITNVACSGYMNGAAQIITSGGVPAYAYLWQPGAQTNSVLTGVSSGNYSCTVTDANGCVSTKTVSITQPNPLIINTNTISSVTCFGASNGQIATNISGGTPSYTINWIPALPATQTVTNLSPGMFTLSVIDLNGCTTNSIYTIVQPSSLTVMSSNTVTACSGPNGSATINIGGGTPAYSYSWAPTSQTTNIASGLTAGNYTLTTTDVKGCVISATVSVPSASDPTLTAISNTSLICNGQTATLTASGANTYSWNTSATGSVIAVSPSVTTIYTVTGTNASGCSNSSTITQSVSLCTALNALSESENSNFKIYPNPFLDEIVVSISDLKNDVKLSIFNSLGQLVYQTQVTKTNSVINLKELPSGLYFVRTEVLGQEKVLKLIKE